MRKRSHELLNLIELSDKAKELVQNLSGGMKQRLSMAIAMINNPQILLLDEPTVGIDPVLRESFWNHFKKLNKNEITILITSHVMDDAMKCDKVIFFIEGKIVAYDTPVNLVKYTKTNNGFIFKDKKGEINLPYPNLLGDFQLGNVCSAISAVRNLSQFKIKETHIKEAITKIRSEGRLQFIKEGKLRRYVSNNNEILIDGGHNVLAAKAIEKYLGSLNSGRKIIMLIGMMSNKEHKEFIQIFKNKIESIIALDIPNQVNFIKKEKLSKIAESCGLKSKTESSIESALKNASKENDNAIIFCTGSLYFAGEILNLN